MIYVIGDIHGDYPSFYKMLQKINFSSSDSLCILGDVVDKGSDNLYLLEFIRHMENVCLIKGNHEYLFERYLQGTITASLWDTCGGSATRSEADRLPEEKKRELLAYLKTLPIYKIITVKGNSIFLPTQDITRIMLFRIRRQAWLISGNLWTRRLRQIWKDICFQMIYILSRHLSGLTGRS